ncbi:hypothetical protein [Actinomadura rubrisoli]|uniref:DUF3558 domain-containing protein n=1 Tax=Actinomadura rubrisoli TaxID=2530368 RepID=A0A4R5BP16_9ACTN|nr:hypothetical protein [Actinomadura rubrisoli]TDD87113.1 hypothetical protein E1298_16610 [Actinomadura rubrisoli]
MTSTHRKVALAASALALALTGCDMADDDSSSPTGSPAPQATAPSAPGGPVGSLPADACALLTKEEAAEVMETKIDLVRAENAGTEKSCSYDDDLKISVAPGTVEDFTSQAEHYEAVAGIGDAAYTGGTALWVLDGTTKITITSGGGPERRTAVARKVITRLAAPSATPAS